MALLAEVIALGKRCGRERSGLLGQERPWAMGDASPPSPGDLGRWPGLLEPCLEFQTIPSSDG